uniref:Uncharacterized protein n=1 Tax=Salarias fasciatus TaxID=181472 RepID=A0A672FWZ7_SALFA
MLCRQQIHHLSSAVLLFRSSAGTGRSPPLSCRRGAGVTTPVRLEIHSVRDTTARSLHCKPPMRVRTSAHCSPSPLSWDSARGGRLVMPSRAAR